MSGGRVCKFFLNNSCKYGSNCRFEHVVSGGYDTGGNVGRGTSVFHREAQPQPEPQQFGGGGGYRDPQQSYNRVYNRVPPPAYQSKAPPAYPQQQQRSAKTYRGIPSEYVELIMVDITASVNGKMWPMSVYGPLKNRPNTLSGFEDHSPEEVRWEFVQAHLSGTLDQFRVNYTATVEQARQVQRHYMEMTTFAVEAIQRYLTPDPVKPSNFAPAQPTPAPNFSFSLSALSNVPQTPPFSPNDSIFGSTTPFSPPSSSSPIGFSTPNFPAPQPSVFSPVPSDPQPTIFGSQPQPPSFSFANPPSGPTNIFGGPPSPTAPVSSSSSDPLHLITRDPDVNMNILSVIWKADQAYTPKEHLSQEDLEQFQAPVFTYGKIPALPPPKELC